MSITVVGSVALDSIKSEAGAVERAIGGAAIHFANAASLCTAVHVVGVVGGDYPFEELEFLKKRGVDLGGIEVVPGGKTFFWKGRYEGGMNQAVTEVTELNVFEGFSPKLEGGRDKPDFLFLANIHPGLQKHVVELADDSAFSALDSMNYWIDNSREELEAVARMVDAVIFNDQEVRSFTGQSNLFSGARKILDMGPSCIIIKRGEHGVLALSRGWTVALPAFPLDRIVDPTGAGDSFAGALVGYLDRFCGKDRDRIMDVGCWKKALAYANCVASYNVQAFSISGIACIGLEDVVARYEEYRQICQIEGGLDVT